MLANLGKQVIEALRHAGMGEDVVTQDPIIQSGIHSDFDQIDHFTGIFAEQDTPQDPIGARIDDGF